MIVTCARCLAEFVEDDPAAIFTWGDWFCRNEAECDDRLTELLEAVDAI